LREKFLKEKLADIERRWEEASKKFDSASNAVELSYSSGSTWDNVLIASLVITGLGVGSSAYMQYRKKQDQKENSGLNARLIDEEN